MSRPLVYVDTSAVREGTLDALKDAIEELVEFLAANEPQLLLYDVCLSDDGTEMTVVHVHADSGSLEYHLDVGGPVFRRFADLIVLSSIRVYGEPSEKAVGQLHDKGRMLGCEDVAVQGRHAGFSRLTTHPDEKERRR
jgi:hypothetical protein